MNEKGIDFLWKWIPFVRNSRYTADEGSFRNRSTSVGSEYLFVHGSDLHSTNALSSDSSQESTGEIGDLELANHNFTGIVVGVTILETRLVCVDRIPV